ncbi:alkaline phosphatase family protein [Nocardiopsis sp. HNM0947]|uniref:Alkaline phosphatase family protein n=1 Tax=Nocardiopsis coralli TaxID=2772213 RepID=A0ABR9PEN5_9ACTN|nr:nucleotide pyrophosphatase/phosphodiesterase family protein [Nocardiopsis coralli]MBE3002289.1 alkaline phosphatase family protein [Nocardiopsis coralli]
MDTPRPHDNAEPTTRLETDIPSYRGDTLSAVTPSLAAALGVPGYDDLLGAGHVRAAAFLLVDGLGTRLLARHAHLAPTLAELARRGSELRSGFPATTATSLAALGTGLPAGESGIVGLSFTADGFGDASPGPALDALSWCAHTPDGSVDLRGEAPPESVQPNATVFERAAADGIEVSRVVPGFHHGSGLTRALLRGPGRFVAADAPDELVPGMLEALRGPGRALVYGYHGELDRAGHDHGPGSERWIEELVRVEALVTDLASDLPADTVLAVVADHGMIHTGEHRIDLDRSPDLLRGVNRLSGEARVRHVHTEPGAVPEVLATWREVLGERAHVVERERAIAEGWYGAVSDRNRGRLGDVIAAARGDWTLVRMDAEPRQSAMIGHHGSWTADEQLVPLLLLRPE